MRGVVVVQKITFQRCDVVCWAAVFESDAVIYARVVDQRIDPSPFFLGIGDRTFAILWPAQLARDRMTSFSVLLQLRLQLAVRLFVAIDADGQRAFIGAGTHDGR